MSHALKTAAVVPTDSVKNSSFKKKLIKKWSCLKKTLVFHSCHRDSDINAVIFWLNIITCAPKIAFCMSHMQNAISQINSFTFCAVGPTWVMAPCATPVRQNITGKRYKQHDLHSWWRYSVILHAILILYFVSNDFVIFLSLISCRRSFFWATPSVLWWHALAKYAVTSQSITDWLAVELCSALIHQCYAIPPRIVFRLGKTAKY